MNQLKNKIVSIWRLVKTAWPFFGFLKKTKVSQEELDRKLVYSLSARKIPNREQIRHLSKFLSPREILIVKICLLIVLVNAVYLSIIFVKKHVSYLPLAGGEYSEGAVGYPQTINPLYAVNRDIDGDLSRLIYSRLFQYDQTGHLIGDLAEKTETSADGKEYLIKIKSGVKWHNGEILTADDILFTFNLIKNPEYHSPLRSSLAGAEAVKIDDVTIKFILVEPYAPFPELLTFGILPKNIWEKITPAAAVTSELNLKPIGSGPYQFKSLVKNRDGELKEYRLIVNADYYDGAAYLKNINFIFFVSYQEAIRALNDNKIMGLSYLPFDARSGLLAQNSLRLQELVRPQIVSLFFNANKNKSLADKEIRTSLATALNKDRLIDEIFAGAYQRADGPLLTNSFAYNENIKKYEYAPAEAAATFTGKPLNVVLTVVDSGSNALVAEKIKDYWEKAGVIATIKIIAGEQAAEIIKNRDFEILLYGEFVGGDPDVYAFWHSSQISDQGLNLSGYSNANADKLLAEARVATDLDERIEKYKKFQEIIAADLPAIFLYSPTYTYVQDQKLKGFNGLMAIEPGDRFSGVTDWYLKTKKKLTW